MSRTIDEIKEFIGARFDPDDLIEIFEISSEEILDRFEDRVLQYGYKFEEQMEEECDEFGQYQTE